MHVFLATSASFGASLSFLPAFLSDPSPALFCHSLILQLTTFLVHVRLLLILSSITFLLLQEWGCSPLVNSWALTGIWHYKFASS